MVLLGMLGTILFISQVALAFLPNVELVSFLVIIYAINYGKKSLFSIYVFALLEGLLYGFGVWWIMYLYVWTILAFAAMLFKNRTSNLFWAILSGAFGLGFGALCSIPYFFIGGISMGVGYWVSGIPFDITHCIANFVVALVLFKPIQAFFARAKVFVE